MPRGRRGGGDACVTGTLPLTSLLRPMFTLSPVSTQTLFLLFPNQKRAREHQNSYM